jgi:hypothetical protein
MDDFPFGLDEMMSHIGSDKSDSINNSRKVTSKSREINVDMLLDSYPKLFPFECFNIVQSVCLPTLVNSDANLVGRIHSLLFFRSYSSVCAPTGSGKTVLFGT